MATSLEEGLSLLKDTVKNNLRHQDYDRVTEIAGKYRKLVTGKDIDTLLEQFTMRESTEMFDQRKRITQQITPSVASSISTPFYKVGRVNSIDKKIAVEGKEKETLLKDFSEAIGTFYGDKSLDKYLETRLVEMNFTDPNAFIVVEFPPFDPNQEKPKPYPFEVSSEKAINYFYDNNILQWLVVQLPISYEKGKEVRPGYSYTIYLTNDSIRFTQVDSDSYGDIQEGETKTYNSESGLIDVFRADKDRVFIIETFEHKAGRVPAVRIGYRRDLSTEGRTNVSPIEPAMPHFMKSLKTVSEFDLTTALHAFPQKIAYVPRCTDVDCISGSTSEGGKCKTCHGTGLSPMHTSAQDAIVIRMPRKGEEDKMIDLDKLIVYKYPPTELLRFQDEQVEKLEAKAHRAIFNSMMFAQNQTVKTATEVDVNLDSVYDTLYSFAERYSDIYVYIGKVIAAFRNVDNISITYRFPKDFKFKGVDELLIEYKTANESGAPGFIKQEISNDIAERQFQDKPEELSRIKIKQRFYPFSDKTSTEVLYLVSNGLTTEYNKVLWANFDLIFREIEQDNPDFYLLAYPKQKTLVDEKVNAIIEALPKATEALSFGSFENEDPEA